MIMFLIRYVLRPIEQTKINTLTRQKNRDIDKILGEQYRKDAPPGMSFTEYKKMWKEAQKLKQMKTHYSAFEPMPDESLEDFKKRLGGATILIPVETEEQFQKRISTAFNQHLFK